jgi:hypothetical protein
MLGVGYVGRTFDSVGAGHGLYVEGGWIQAREIDEGAVRRLSVSLAPETLYRRGLWGFGGAVSVGAAIADFGSSSHVGRRTALVSYGEGEIGVHLTAGFERVDRQTRGFALLGIRGSIHGLAGLVFIPEVLDILWRR